MSYILDALRKAEQKRKLENIPELESAIVRGNPAQQRWPWRWLFAAVILLLLAAALIFFRQPLLARGRLLLGDSGTEPSSATVEQVAAPAAKAAPKPPARQTTTQTDRSIDRSRPPVDRSGPRAPRRDAEPLQREVNRPPSRTAAPEPVVEPVVKTPPAAVEAPNTTDQSPSLLPAALQQKLDAVNLTVISFSTDPVKRFVMVGAEILREGDSLPGGILISQIRRREVLVEIDGREALLTL